MLSSRTRRPASSISFAMAIAGSSSAVIRLATAVASCAIASRSRAAVCSSQRSKGCGVSPDRQAMVAHASAEGPQGTGFQVIVQRDVLGPLELIAGRRRLVRRLDDDGADPGLQGASHVFAFDQVLPGSRDDRVLEDDRSDRGGKRCGRVKSRGRQPAKRLRDGPGRRCGAAFGRVRASDNRRRSKPIPASSRSRCGAGRRCRRAG